MSELFVKTCLEGLYVSRSGKFRREVDDEMYEIVPYIETTNYLRFRYKGKLYYVHRILAMTFIPNPENKRCVDHCDGNKLNNALSNLRWCTNVENSRNTLKRYGTSSHYKGVSYDKRTKKWRARIVVDGSEIFLGRHSTQEEAANAYNEAAKKFHKEFANLNIIN